MVELMSQLRALTEAWDAETPPITLDEVSARATASGPDRIVAAPDAALDTHNGRRLVVVLAAAAVVGLIVGLVALTGRPGPTPPGLTTIDTEPRRSSTTDLPTSSLSTSTLPNTTTLQSTSTAPASTVLGNTTSELAEVERSVDSLLAGFDSFSATIRSRTDGFESTNRVVMLSDGRIWSEGSPIEWQSFDPQTGVAQMTSRHDDGTTVNLRYRDMATIPMVPALGLDPLPRFALMAADTQVAQKDLDGRSVWSLTSERGDQTGARHHEVFDIDKTTGLVIHYSSSVDANNTTSTAEATMTDIQLGAQLPSQFPGEFPIGADVQDSGAGTFQVLDVNDAAKQFGDGFLVSATGQPARILVSQGIVQTIDNVVTAVPTSMATIEYHSGFSYATVKLTRSQLPASGGFCHSTNGTTCDSATGPSVVTSGPLAGAPSTLANGVLNISSGALTVEITAASDDEAVRIANSLVAP